ncbi:HEPN domain-containing protein [Microbacterium sp. SSM24]|uniref:HEPN domain-containing protein n=1 Tax=Microbacterium sp. SSM24 TaxID=2991714 RepID=UPI002226FCC8|nr:HEPN domain-containing protein [Microbacterium sp. SSM24]MCW3493888.1 HEPN domain-containing protein [Microbacterium sp. SSM24]
MTAAATEYRQSSAMVASLMTLESSYQDPPPIVDRSTVEGLRGGAVVLMVGAFEHYLKQSTSELLDSLNRATPPVVFSKLPLDLQAQAVYTGLESAMKAKSWDPIKDRTARLPGVIAAAAAVHSGVLLSADIANTAGNPNPEQLRSIYKVLGYPGVFAKIKSAFDREWGGPTASTFIEDTLDTVVSRRHAVAHTASILNISRTDLNQWHGFLNALVTVLDDTLTRHVKRIARKAI